MKILLDTNIVIHREGNHVKEQSIGVLFNWLDKLSYQKWILPATQLELSRYYDPKTIQIKAQSYNELKTTAPETPQLEAIRKKYDHNANDTVDTDLLREVLANRVDYLLTQDRKIHRKANELGIAERVFTIDTFLEKAIAENPDLTDYKVLSVRRQYFGNINLAAPFFDSFKNDYAGFENWFGRKAQDEVYICTADDSSILAFLYIKREMPDERYSDIEPTFSPKRRLKIGTFKVVANGYKLGERFLKIVFDNAFKQKVDEVYVTLYDRTADQERLVSLLLDWGFYKHGIKHSEDGDELVFVRDFKPQIDIANPALTYPYISKQASKFIVPIYPEYHTELLPDSILRTESPKNFIEDRPNRNAISKVYISRSRERSMKPGDIIVFYRTKADQPAFYTAVTTTIGVVQNVIDDIPNLNKFMELCRKRSVFTDDKLREQWNRNPQKPPFIVNFLYVYSFPKKLNLKQLQELGIIRNAPRGFEPLTDEAFKLLMENSNGDKRIIVS